MTATTPQPMEGTQAPNQIEYLYERYRPALKWLLVVVVGVFAAYYFFKYQQQKAVDEYWTQFNVTIGTEGIYTQEHAGLPPALTDLLADQDLAELESRLAAADAQQKPFLLITVARKAMLDGNWDRAESALTELETQYPKHSLVTADVAPDPDPRAEGGRGSDPRAAPQARVRRAGRWQHRGPHAGADRSRA